MRALPRRRLLLRNPEEILRALGSNSSIVNWLKSVSNHYNPPKKKVLLVYPCSAKKPYHKSQSYRQLFKTLEVLGDKRNNIHLATISEPYGLIPEEFYENDRWLYDCPGLFEWWCKKHSQPYSVQSLDECINILAEYTSKFLIKASKRKCYTKYLAFVRTYTSGLEKKHDHTHRRIVERAGELSGVEIEILPTRKQVASIVKKSGRFAWDMYGVGHPLAQRYLLKNLQRVLDNEY